MVRQLNQRNLFTALVAIWSISSVAIVATAAEPTVPAFPGAEGYGAQTRGGRGGKVIAVTNLNESGPGSFREAIEAKGPRTVVFRVSGTIEGKYKIKNDFITIAGQTAPGDGICIRGSLSIGASEVIIRYVRVRPDPSIGEVDAITSRYNKNIILDHVSASWSSDEVLTVYWNENVTIQWCMITEACAKFVNGKNTGHRFGGIWGNDLGTYHHNLFAHNDSRNPRWGSGVKRNDYRNNVVYNWGYNSCYGGEYAQPGEPDRSTATFNMVANVYKPGPATKPKVQRRIAEPSTRGNGVADWYVADNWVVGFPEVTNDNWLGVDGDDYRKLNTPWNAMSIQQQTPQEALDSVIAEAGCSFPVRDSIDQRIMKELQSGTATFGENGIITHPKDVGGWPELKSQPAPSDRDNDGMPDSWETEHGLDPDDSADGAEDGNGDGYTHLEDYLNSLVTG
ncbi:pectate lyase family protein [Rhodopirellula halodulae]|uniref:pectate lyase family protein n=1 Tax=Rhodopirellula halodulae TaxID=2894198 RepID=UPI001E448A97|nr:pectate lyase [Rhodopirellula sp. JC737]MCC9654296.1 pectate lyase [Rhodopirellula sp. JC737]